MTNEAMRALEEMLPRKFPFYHLGEVELEIESVPTLDPKDRIGIGFSIQGDLSAFFLVLIDQGLDLSTYSELGNVLVSKILGALSQGGTRFDVVASVPRILTSHQLIKVLHSGDRPWVKGTYLHIHQGITVRVEICILPAQTEGAGNA